MPISSLVLGLLQLSKAELVGIILTQHEFIEELRIDIENLKLSRDLDSKTSSKPPSTDWLKKSEKAKLEEEKSTEQKKKRKPGGQPGHQGKTRKGFGKTDRLTLPHQIKDCDAGFLLYWLWARSNNNNCTDPRLPPPSFVSHCIIIAFLLLAMTSNSRYSDFKISRLNSNYVLI